MGLRYFGPFQIIECIGSVADMPENGKTHVFHVGLLKTFKGDPPGSTPALPPLLHGRVCPTPEKILNSRLTCGP